MTVKSKAAKSKKMDIKLGVQFEIRAGEDFVEKIDDWRVSQRPILSRAEAIRRLCILGLEAAMKQKRK